jgi:tyrosinase
MTLPKEAELLGANPGELEIKGAGAHTFVRLTPDGQRKFAALIDGNSAGPSSDGVYLGLENIRGTFDAAVLTAYINLPENARPGDHDNLRTESVGLYGLRRASMREGESVGDGLTFLLDITHILVGLISAKSLNLEEIPVRIVPDGPLPESTDIVVGRVSIFATPPN